ncbi:hypothetical protein E4H12_15800 [Candidatus Thorarchaeota archaeon]|nr:MAG: hypothetical protein E4H12_15800 [Candidatus Thorarchaeota archaeon]
MKLFEVMYPKCKTCGYDFSEGGRDHRSGVCDKCAFPDKKKKRVKENAGSAFQSQIEDLLWSDYQQDPFLPAGEESADEMSDEDYLDFGDHVRDVMKFARTKRITDPQEALKLYHQNIVDSHKSQKAMH